MRGSRTHAFVGRHDELRVLDEMLAQAASGRPAIALIEGEPGVGKTALLRQFLRLHAGVLQVWVSGDEAEVSLEFGVVDQLRAAADPPAAGRSGDSSPRDSFAVGAELLSVLDGLQDQGTVVVVVDDLHWTDLASSRAMLFWLRRLREDSLLIVLTARPHALDRLGESWPRLFADSGRARSLRLTGLSTAEVRQLAAAAGQQLPAAASDRLCEHTGGSPLYVTALLEELDPGVLCDRAALPAPRSYAATVLARSSRLSAPARELLAAAAVLGNHCPISVATKMASTDLTGAPFDELVDGGLLAWSSRERPDEIEFTHPLVRAAVYEDLSPSRRRGLHLCAAGLLAPATALGHRVAAADGSDDELAGQLVEAADAEINAGRPLAAAEHLLSFWRLASSPEVGTNPLLRAVELLLIGGDVATAHLHARAVDGCIDGPHKRFVQAALAASISDLVVCLVIG